MMIFFKKCKTFANLAYLEADSWPYFFIDFHNYFDKLKIIFLKYCLYVTCTFTISFCTKKIEF